MSAYIYVRVYIIGVTYLLWLRLCPRTITETACNRVATRDSLAKSWVRRRYVTPIVTACQTCSLCYGTQKSIPRSRKIEILCRSRFATLLQRYDTQSLTDCEPVYHNFARESPFFTLLQRSDTLSAFYRSRFATLLQSYDTQSLRETARLCMRGGGLGSRPKKMYGERLGDGVEYHLMSPTPRR